MKHIRTTIIALTTLFLTSLLHAQEAAHDEFLRRISRAFMESDLDTVISMTYWNGVSPEEKIRAIDKYKKDIALTATKVELLGKDAATWKDWKKGGTAYTYNSDVLHTLVVHLQEGSKVQLSFGEVTVRDFKLPIGFADGKLCILRSVPKEE